MIDHLIETGNSEEMFQSAFEPMGQDKVDVIERLRKSDSILSTSLTS